MFSDTSPASRRRRCRAFVAAEIIGGALAVVVIRALYPGVTPAEAADIMVPHHRDWPDADTQTVRPGMGSQAAADGNRPFPGRPTGLAGRSNSQADGESHASHCDRGQRRHRRAAGLRELDTGADVTVVVADAYPNFSICGIPYYVSGEVTHWRNLAHRTAADLEAAGMQLRLATPPHAGSTPAAASSWSPPPTAPSSCSATTS